MALGGSADAKLIEQDNQFVELKHAFVSATLNINRTSARDNAAGNEWLPGC